MVKGMLQKEFSTWAKSFRLQSIFLYVFAADALFWLLSFLAFSSISKFITEKSLQLTGGLDAAQFQQYFLSLTELQLQAFSAQLKGLVIILVLLLAAGPVIALFLYSFSRAYIWNLIAEKHFTKKRYWKWNGLNLLLLVFSLAFVLVMFLFNLASKRLAGSFLVQSLLKAAIVDIFLIAFSIFALIAAWHFVNSYHVFRSIGDTFGTVKREFKQISTVFLFSLATLVALQIVQLPLRNLYFLYPAIGNFIQAGIFLLYLAWLRTYVVGSLFKG